MKRIFAIDGAAGTGKTDLLHFASHDLHGSIGIVKKYTTRPLRDVERKVGKQLDLNFVDESFLSTLGLTPERYYEYSYPRSGGHRYILLRDDLDKALSEFDTVFVILRSAKAIKNLQEDYARCEVIPLFVYTLESGIRQRLQDEGYPRSEIEYRLQRSHEAMEDYYNFPSLYRAVLINNSDMRTYKRAIIEAYNKFTLGDESYLEISNQDRLYLPKTLRPYRGAMLQRLKEFPYDRNVFIMMAFDKTADNHFAVLNVTLRNEGYNAVRADNPYWNITNDDIMNPYAALFCCKHGIALFGAEQPSKVYNVNVGIEAGIMMMQDKRCLILKGKELDRPPFDLASRIHVEFAREGDLIAEVQKWLKTL